MKEQASNSNAWKQDIDQRGIVFRKDPQVDPRTGVVTTWEKTVAAPPLNSVYMRSDRFPDGLLDRSIVGGVDEKPEGQTIYTVRKRDEQEAQDTVMFVRSNQAEQGEFPIRFHYDLAKVGVPEGFNARGFSAVYDSGSGELRRASIVIESPDRFNEEEIRAKPVAENIADVVSRFQTYGSETGVPFLVTKEMPRDNDMSWNDIHVTMTREMHLRGKLKRWKRAGVKEQVYREVDTLMEAALSEHVEDLPEQLREQIFMFLGVELLKALPDNYHRMNNRRKAGALLSALQDACMATIHLSDSSINRVGTYSVMYLRYPQNPQGYVFGVMEGNDDWFESGVHGQILQGGSPEANEFDNKVFLFDAGEDGTTIMALKPNTDNVETIGIRLNSKIQAEKAVNDITTDEQTGWEKVFDYAQVGIKGRTLSSDDMQEAMRKALPEKDG